MPVGAGALAVLAAGAGLAGSWLPVAVLVAGLLAVLTAWLGGRRRSVVDRARGVSLAKAARIAGVLRGAMLVSVFATTFGAYLLPGSRLAVALLLIAVVAAADAAGLRLSVTARSAVAGLLLAAAAGFVALCFAVPSENVSASSGTPSALGVAGAVLAVFGLVVPGVRRAAVGTVVLLAVGGAAAHQLGAARLGLAVTSLRDALDVADGRQLATALGAVVVLAVVPAALAGIGDARAALRGTPVAAALATGMAAALFACLLSPVQAFVSAGALALVELGAGGGERGNECPPVVFRRGQTVVQRFLRPDGGVGQVHPLRVISDDGRSLLGWLPEGTRTVGSRLADGRRLREAPPAERFLLPRTSVPDVWHGSSTLRLVVEDQWSSVWWFFSRGEFTGWYVNLEIPLGRRAGGVDRMDGILDLVVSPDRSRRWKDEEEAEAAVAAGRLTAAQLERLRAEGRRMAALADAGEFPFDGSWVDFRPGDWPNPELPRQEQQPATEHHGDQREQRE